MYNLYAKLNKTIKYLYEIHIFNLSTFMSFYFSLDLKTVFDFYSHNKQRKKTWLTRFNLKQ